MALHPHTLHKIQAAFALSRRFTMDFLPCECTEGIESILFEKEWHLLITEHPSNSQMRFLREFKQSEEFSHVPIVTIEEYDTVDTRIYKPDLVLSPQCNTTVIHILLEGILNLSTRLSELIQEHAKKKEAVIDNYIMIELLSEYLSDTTIMAARRQTQHQTLQLDSFTQKVTVLFLDICNFTGYSTSHNAKKIIEYLNSLYSLIIPIIREYDGDIDKFIGDGCLTVFSSARNAIQAALHIFELLKYKHPPELPNTALHAGIHTGEVIRCRIGGNNRFDYTLIGKVVNTAAKLQHHAKEHNIMVSEESVREAGIQLSNKDFRQIIIGKGYNKVSYVNIFHVYEATMGKFSPVTANLPTTELGDEYKLRPEQEETSV